MRASIGGMSLVELMVVVGIVGVITTLALPRYNSLITSSRRGEAKGQLNTLHTLQETYRAEHGGYYSGLEVGYFKDGRKVRCRDDDNTGIELDNKLGFRPNDCIYLRYGYTSSGGGGKAFAPSDAGQRWIYPDCSGAGCVECSEDQGDVLTMSAASAAAGKPRVCRNITKYCPDGGTPCGSVPVIPPPPCICGCYWTFGSQQTSDPSKHICEKTKLERVDTCAYTRKPPGCVGPPCPSPTTRKVPYTVDGVKALYDPSTTPPTEASLTTNPCGCKGSPDPRPSCGSCVCTQTPANCPPSPTKPATITALAAEYPCQNVEEIQNVTIDCTPATDPPCTAPFTRATTRPCAFAGTKSITCANICKAWQVGQWSDCKEVRPDEWEEWRISSRDCTNPCPGMDIVDASGNPVASCEHYKPEKRVCSPPIPVCMEGDAAYIGDKVEDAKPDCLETPIDPTKSFVAEATADPNDDPTHYHCTCNTCAVCHTSEVRNPYTADRCDCINLDAALECCYLTNTKLDEVRQFVQTNNAACGPLRGTSFGGTINNLVAPQRRGGMQFQDIWSVFYKMNLGSWSTEGTNCFNGLWNEFLKSDPNHPIFDLDLMEEHLFLATRGCERHSTYRGTGTSGCPTVIKDP